jgi:hypothetical protein
MTTSICLREALIEKKELPSCAAKLLPFARGRDVTCAKTKNRSETSWRAAKRRRGSNRWCQPSCAENSVHSGE